jgi:NADPH-dependent 2,4-dienoyl-CoA reductase/sulfur reductase-like enzyme/rhodanese-related sulfurtransferase
MEDRVLIVGSDGAALEAASKIRRENPGAEIEILIPINHLLLEEYAVPDFIEGEFSDYSQVQQYIIEYYKSKFNINIRESVDVIEILPSEKKIIVREKDADSKSSEDYDKLVLSTGSIPVVPQIDGIGLKRIFTIKDGEEAYEIGSLISERNIKQAIVIGGGLRGVKIAATLAARDIYVTLIEKGSHILPELDVEIADIVHKYLEEKGMEVLTGEKVLSFIGNAEDEVVECHTPNYMLHCELVVWTGDEQPNTKLAKTADIAVDNTGGILTNKEMQTNIPDIYAVGRCTGQKFRFYGAGNPLAVKVFDMNIVKVGLTYQEAKDSGYEAVAGLAWALDNIDNSPGTIEIDVRLTADRESHRILGGQFVGEVSMDKPVELLMELMSRQGKVEDLVSYPKLSGQMEVMSLAANGLKCKLEERYQTISPVQLHDILEDPDLIILDIRPKAEVMMGTLPGAISIPGDVLKDRIDELEQDKTIVLLAKWDNSACEAYESLKASGFDQVKIMEGGIFAYPYRLV